MSEYIKLKEFWNNTHKSDEVEKVDGKWVTYDSFNNAIKEFIKEDATILDYGCGQGWASFEIAYTVKLKECIGIDTSSNAVEYSNKVAELSDLNNLIFYTADESILEIYKEYFDNIVSFNVLDVLPDRVINNILKMWKHSLKKDGIIIVGINSDFPRDFLVNRGFSFKNNKLYKDGILRGNEKTIEDWEALFNKYFEIVDKREFALLEMELKYPRRMFVLRQK